MHPSFGVPWPRLQRAAERLSELHAPATHGRVHALLFLCGLKYLFTYREATGRRLSHYLDDGLREFADHTLPVLMKHCAEAQRPRSSGGRIARTETNAEFSQLAFAFDRLHQRMPALTAEWIKAGRRDTNLIRLTFGIGVVARFAPDSHLFVREMLQKPLVLTAPVLDVLESFRWHPEWSVMLAR